MPDTVIVMLDNQAKHLNGVPPKTEIAHGIYSARPTFLRMRGLGNIQSPRTEKGTSQRSIIFKMCVCVCVCVLGYT